TRHLHRDYSFTGSLVETAPKSLRHSCRSELRVIPPFPEAQTIPSPCQQRCEDCSSVISPATARIHSACDPDDLSQAFSTLVRAVRHQPADEREPLEVEPLAGHQRV